MGSLNITVARTAQFFFRLEVCLGRRIPKSFELGLGDRRSIPNPLPWRGGHETKSGAAIAALYVMPVPVR